MISTALNNVKETGLISKLNYSWVINLVSPVILFIYLFCSKNHFYNYEQSKTVEVFVGLVLLLLITANYILLISSSKQLNSNKFTLTYRHLLYITFIVWIILAIFSKGAIAIGEISPLVYFLFLVELFHTSHQKSLIIDTNIKRRTSNIKAMFFSGFLLMGVMLWVFYFIFDYRLSPFEIILNWFVYGLYVSLVALNANLIFFLLFGKTNLTA
jgi:hypothetical protein